MIALHIISVGSDKDRWVAEAAEHYKTLLSKYARVEFSQVPHAVYGKAADIPSHLKKEAAKIESAIKGGYVIALDVKGSAYTTEDLAGKLAKILVGGHSRLEFIIGGPYGLHPSIKEKADLVLSLSPLTMSHQVVRLVLLEQLYRLLDLNAGGKYHK